MGQTHLCPGPNADSLFPKLPHRVLGVPMAEANLSAYKTWIYEFYFQIFFILQVLIQFNISYALRMQTEGNQYENAI